MSAFAGLSLPTAYPDVRSTDIYIPGQSAFRLTKTFTLADLEKTVQEAIENGDSHFYTGPQDGFSGYRLSTWYGKALIEYLKDR